MNKKEVLEIKKLFTKERFCIHKICGCYVNSEKEKVFMSENAFLSLPEEEIHKYLDIFRKSLSGSIGKNLINLEFPSEQEKNGGVQQQLLYLRDSELKNQEAIAAFYDRIIELYDEPDHYYINLIYGSYDVPGKSSDGLTSDEPGEDVYNYILCCICNMHLSKPGLCYAVKEECIKDRFRDRIMNVPEVAFLFPAFNDRCADIHNILYYSKNAKILDPNMIHGLLKCKIPNTAQEQQKSLNSVIHEVFSDHCDFETVCSISDCLTDLEADYEAKGEIPSVDKQELEKIFEKCGANSEQLQNFSEIYADGFGEQDEVIISNVTNPKTLDIKTADISIKVNKNRTDLTEMGEYNGRKCMVVYLDGRVTVNGVDISLKENE